MVSTRLGVRNPPRPYGTFPKLLGDGAGARMAEPRRSDPQSYRQAGVVVSLAGQRKSRVRQYPDVTIFDPKTIRTMLTYEKPDVVPTVQGCVSERQNRRRFSDGCIKGCSQRTVLMNIYDLDTPALLVDFGTMDRNLRRMATYCAAHHLALRPHTKTHKIPEIARLQMQYGATGITVAKLGEAELDGRRRRNSAVLIVYPICGRDEMEARGGAGQASQDLRCNGFLSGSGGYISSSKSSGC